MEAFQNLKKWLKIKDNIHMYDRPHRGLYTSKDIKKDTEIIKIKPSHLIEYSNAYKKFPVDNVKEQNSITAMVLVIADLEKDPFWKHYIDTFPKDFSNHIIYYDDKKKALLKNTSLSCNGFYTYYDHIKSIEHDSKVLYKYCKKTGLLDEYNITYDAFHKLFVKYRIMVASRIFGYLKNGEHESGMVPYVDLLNYSPVHNTTWYYDDNQDAFILRATENISKNSELLDDYGEKSNIEFLLYYGFTIPNNKNSTLRINYKKNPVELNKTSILSESVVDVIGLKKALQKMYEHHIKMLPKIKDENIMNIYLDEIDIIRVLK
jgi:hypothetical protein